MVKINSKERWVWHNPTFELKVGEHTYDAVPAKHAAAVMALCSTGMATLHGVPARKVSEALAAGRKAGAKEPDLSAAIASVAKDEARDREAVAAVTSEKPRHDSGKK
jgi:hypothetical protein